MAPELASALSATQLGWHSGWIAAQEEGLLCAVWSAARVDQLVELSCWPSPCGRPTKPLSTSKENRPPFQAPFAESSGASRLSAPNTSLTRIRKEAVRSLLFAVPSSHTCQHDSPFSPGEQKSPFPKIQDAPQQVPSSMKEWIPS